MLHCNQLWLGEAQGEAKLRRGRSSYAPRGRATAGLVVVRMRPRPPCWQHLYLLPASRLPQYCSVPQEGEACPFKPEFVCTEEGKCVGARAGREARDCATAGPATRARAARCVRRSPACVDSPDPSRPRACPQCVAEQTRASTIRATWLLARTSLNLHASWLQLALARAECVTDRDCENHPDGRTMCNLQTNACFADQVRLPPRAGSAAAHGLHCQSARAKVAAATA